MYKGLAVGYVMSSSGFGGGQARLLDLTEFGFVDLLLDGGRSLLSVSVDGFVGDVVLFVFVSLVS